ncbi:MAG: hypothetical protein LRS47_01180 [Desulfurococcales archaeon]|nr:hypothetical protein [Desulfurococcales archaeon]
MKKLSINVPDDVYLTLESIAEKKGASVDEILTQIVRGALNYVEEIDAYAEENSVNYETAASELLDYGVILWDEIVSMILDILHIDRQVLLDDLLFDHIDSSIILVLSRTEEGEGMIDEVTIDLGCEGVSLYAIHYLREGEKWILKELPEGFEPVYDKEDNALIVKTRGKSLEDLPTYKTLERIVSDLIEKHA